MKRLLSTLFLAGLALVAAAQTHIKVEAPNMVGMDENFNVTFIIEGEDKPSDFNWSPGSDFQLVWGPQTGTSTSISIINGKRTKSSQFTFTYILAPRKAGKFQLQSATATVKGNPISSSPISVEVVTNSPSSSSNGNSSTGSGGGNSLSSGSAEVSSTGDISNGDLFMKFSLSRNSAVVGEPLTATLKLYQRVDIAGFEDAKFPTFNGFWSQETEAPSNIEFQRESLNDKIYNTAVLRRYVLIPQQAGALHIDPAELVCLVNVRTTPKGSNSIFDSFFGDEVRTVRKRLTTPAVTLNVKALPSGAPESYGGGVGTFSMNAKVSKDSLKTHEAASLTVTISGNGNVSLLEAPKVNFPSDFEAYDVKSTESTTAGGTSGSKTFEFPFIPRSHGEFTIDPIEYSYYDVNSGKYVTLKTEPMVIKVAKGNASDAGSGSMTAMPSVDRKGVRNLGEDIRYIVTKQPSLKSGNGFLVGKAIFWILAFIIAVAAIAVRIVLRGMAARKADVAGSRNRAATKRALKRLQQANDFLKKDLYTAFYEELHRAILDFFSDKLNMSVEDLNKDNIAERLREGGVSDGLVKESIDLLDACEFARYSPDGGNTAMAGHYEEAVKVISSIDSSMKQKNGSKGTAAAMAIMLMLIPAAHISAADSQKDSLWRQGVTAYEAGNFAQAAQAWEAISAEGVESSGLYYNIGNAWFKDGNTPKAILNYERALKLDPSYSDARFNLEFAQSQTQDKIDPVPDNILVTIMKKVGYIFSSNTWAVLALLFFALTLAMLLVFMLAPSMSKRRAGFWSAIVLAVFCLCSFGFAASQRHDWQKADSAVVMSAVSSIKSSPSGESAKDLFVLHEGTIVKILDSVGEWTNIELADGRQGWIRSTDMEII